MAHSIQKKVKFSKGQIAPELVERTDLDIYDSSAQEITNLTSTVYGGVRTRRGTKYLSDIYGSTTTGTVTNNIGGTTADIQNLDNQFVSGNVGTVRELMSIDYGSVINSAGLIIKNIRTSFLKLIQATSSTSFTIPQGISSVYVDCVGAKGKDTTAKGGKGGRVRCDLDVTEGDVLELNVGTVPTGNVSDPSYNASDIRFGGSGYSNRIIVAGGGGNAGYNKNGGSENEGGAGGGTTGGSGSTMNASYAGVGLGGTQTAGGAGGIGFHGNQGHHHNGGNGSLGIGGAGSYESGYEGPSGAGGGGYYGGGGGAGSWNNNGAFTAGGGGGSSYTSNACHNVLHTQGYRDGAGWITIGINKIKLDIQTSQDGITYTTEASYNISEQEEDISIALTDFRYVKIVMDLSAYANLTGNIYLDYIRLNTNLATDVKLIPYAFNNEQEYVIALMAGRIGIYEKGNFVQDVAATVIQADFLKDIKYTAKDDTIILTHKDMPPQQLQRTNSGFVLSNFPYTNLPTYAFGGETTATKTVSITPSATEGAIKITAASSVFDSGYVGQFIDGNGGRVRITEYVSGTVVNGVTVIPFYTEDAIASWTYISGYEAVWSATRGYPRTCLFAQQRLWFGGSRDLPAHLWASRINDYNNFKNAGNYDNDAIDVTMLTNNPIINLLEQRGLHIFTSGEEWTVSEASYTPKDISLKCNTKNGSLGIEPVVVDGVVLYIEKNGKSLLGYVYNYEQASYTSDNMSMLNNLLNKPVDMDAEINSNTDRGNFLFIVLEDGTMISGCVAISESVFSLSKFVTNGNIKGVCCLSSDTYIAVERNGYLYLERLTFDKTDFTKTFFVNGQTINNMDEYNNRYVYLQYGDKVEVYYVVNSSVTLKEPYTGYVTAGLVFSYKLQSNPIAINNKTTTCKKRISKATLVCKNTERLTFCGQTKSGDYTFYACTPYKDDVRFEITGEYYPIEVLSVTLNLNYEG